MGTQSEKEKKKKKKERECGWRTRDWFQFCTDSLWKWREYFGPIPIHREDCSYLSTFVGKIDLKYYFWAVDQTEAGEGGGCAR